MHQLATHIRPTCKFLPRPSVILSWDIQEGPTTVPTHTQNSAHPVTLHEDRRQVNDQTISMEALRSVGTGPVSHDNYCYQSTHYDALISHACNFPTHCTRRKAQVLADVVGT